MIVDYVCESDRAGATGEPGCWQPGSGALRYAPHLLRRTAASCLAASCPAAAAVPPCCLCDSRPGAHEGLHLHL